MGFKNNDLYKENTMKKIFSSYEFEIINTVTIESINKDMLNYDFEKIKDCTLESLIHKYSWSKFEIDAIHYVQKFREMIEEELFDVYEFIIPIKDDTSTILLSSKCCEFTEKENGKTIRDIEFYLLQEKFIVCFVKINNSELHIRNKEHAMKVLSSELNHYIETINEKIVLGNKEIEKNIKRNLTRIHKYNELIVQ